MLASGAPDFFLSGADVGQRAWSEGSCGRAVSLRSRAGAAALSKAALPHVATSMKKMKLDMESDRVPKGNVSAHKTVKAETAANLSAKRGMKSPAAAKVANAPVKVAAAVKGVESDYQTPCTHDAGNDGFCAALALPLCQAVDMGCRCDPNR